MAESANAPEQPSITKLDLISFFKSEGNELIYPNILELINHIFKADDKHKFTYSNKKTDLGGAEDTFVKIEPPSKDSFNLDNLHAWYMTKNPNFAPTETLDISMPEFKFITAVMIKNLAILYSTSTFPIKDVANNKHSNNYNLISFNLHKLTDKSAKNEISSLFYAIDTMLAENLKYLAFLDILKKYLLMFSVGKYNGDQMQYAEILDYVKTTPYILYPSVMQLSFDKVIYTGQAPLLNFRLTNSRMNIHSSYAPPIDELFHDVDLHGYSTHEYTQNYIDDIIIKRSTINYKDVFAKLNTVINIVKPFIKYSLIKVKPTKANTHVTIDTNKDFIEYFNAKLLAYAIFTIYHESRSGINNLFDIINALTNKLTTYINYYYYDSIPDCLEYFKFKLDSTNNTRFGIGKLIFNYITLATNYKEFKHAISKIEKYKIPDITITFIKPTQKVKELRTGGSRKLTRRITKRRRILSRHNKRK